MPEEKQQSPFKELAAGLPDQHRAEFFKVLHEAGIGQHDVELARLLRALQIYKAYYESIPAAVQEAAGRIEQLKKEIESFSMDARGNLDLSAHLAGQVIQETERIHQDFVQINKHIENAMRQSAESLASHMADHLTMGIEQKVLAPLQSRLDSLAGSNKAFDDAIARNNKATAALQISTAQARRLHNWTYFLCCFLVICMSVSGAYFLLHRWYAGRIEAECEALAKQSEKNHAVLLELAKSHRTLELVRDPAHSGRKLLVMKNASGWQSAGKCGVIEFSK
jgi:hypothetical protein